MEQRTLSDFHDLVSDDRDSGNGYYLSSRTYNSGDAELFSMKLEKDDSLRRGGGSKRRNTEKAEMTEATLNKSIQRSKVIVKRKCLTFCPDRMLTLTFRENVTDIEAAWKCFAYFSKLMKWRYGEKYTYVAVPEYQKRGAVHFHLAVKGYYSANTVRRLWLRAAGDFGGNIDITSPRRAANKNSWNPKRISNYISKYLSKSDSVGFNRKRYSASKNIDIPEPTTGWVCVGIPIVSVMVTIMEQLTRTPYRVLYESDFRYPFAYIST